jgi:outer membrane lipoprotein-sorting protein
MCGRRKHCWLGVGIAGLATLLTLGLGLTRSSPNAAAAAAADPPDLQTVLKSYDTLFRADSSISVFEMHVVRPNTAMRTLKMKAWSKGTDKALIRILSPQREAGTATLRVGKEMWNYLPRIAKTIRVGASAMTQSWNGSDFSNDDLVHASSVIDDFDAKYDGHNDDPAGWIIQLTAKAGVVGLWQRVELVVSDDGTLPLRARYYDRKDQLARTMTFDQVKTFGDRTVPTHMVLVPADNAAKRTGINYSDISFNADVPDDTFSLDNLAKAQ